jgi:hypothetical protein
LVFEILNIGNYLEFIICSLVLTNQISNKLQIT